MQDAIYLAGPMRGYDLFNFPAFDHYAAKLRDLGHRVISPAELDREAGFDEHADHDPDEVAGLMRDFMRRDLNAIIDECKAIALMPGWEQSSGVKVELALAQVLGLTVLDAVHGCAMQPERSVGDPRFHSILKEMADLHDKKQKDYGTGGDPLANVRASEAWGIPPWVGGMIRACDKVKRLQTFYQTGKLANEGAEDAFLDLAVYAILCLILFREDVVKEHQHQLSMERAGDPL